MDWCDWRWCKRDVSPDKPWIVASARLPRVNWRCNVMDREWIRQLSGSPIRDHVFLHTFSLQFIYHQNAPFGDLVGRVKRGSHVLYKHTNNNIKNNNVMINNSPRNSRHSRKGRTIWWSETTLQRRLPGQTHQSSCCTRKSWINTISEKICYKDY